MDSTWKAVVRLARRQHGAVARRQALDLGLPPSTWQRRLEVEGWSSPVPGIATAPWPGDDVWRRLSVAGLAAWPDGAVSSDSSLLAHGARVPVATPPIVVLPHDHHGVGRRGADVLRSRTLRPDDLTVVRHVRVTTPERAVLDLAVRASLEVLRERLIDLRQQRIVSLEAVRARADEARGMTGRPRLVRAIREVSGTGADSLFTRMVEDLLFDAGLQPDPIAAPIPAGQRELHPDITFAAARVAIECDSMAFHADQRTIDLDSRKHNAYALAGWTALRVTWRRYQRDRDRFVGEVRSAITRSGL